MATAAQPVNGTASPAELELERRRNRDRERQRAYRARLRTDDAAPPAPLPVTRDRAASAQPEAAPPVHSRGTLHETPRLESLRVEPEAFADVPPAELELGPPPPPPEPSPAALAGAQKIAGLAAVLVRLTLDDVSARFPQVRELGAQMGAADLDQAKIATVTWAHATVLRCCAKHGWGFAIPYEDELVTLGIFAGCGVYQWARLTGALDRVPGHGDPAAPARRTSPASGAPDPVNDDDEADSEWGNIRLERNDATAKVPAWMAPAR